MLTPELEQIIHELKDNQAALYDKFDELEIDFDDWGTIISEYKQKYPPKNLVTPEEGIIFPTLKK